MGFAELGAKRLRGDGRAGAERHPPVDLAHRHAQHHRRHEPGLTRTGLLEHVLATGTVRDAPQVPEPLRDLFVTATEVPAGASGSRA